MTDTYKLLDLGRQILVSLISRVSSLDLKINNVSVYLSLLLFLLFIENSLHKHQTRTGILWYFPACLFSPRWTQRMVVKRELLYRTSLFIPRTLITLTGTLHKKLLPLLSPQSEKKRLIFSNAVVAIISSYKGFSAKNTLNNCGWFRYQSDVIDISQIPLRISLEKCTNHGENWFQTITMCMDV